MRDRGFRGGFVSDLEEEESYDGQTDRRTDVDSRGAYVLPERPTVMGRELSEEGNSCR
jgi:hypothetical protein